MYTIGIGDVTHDSSVCLVKDGVVIAAIESERLSRVKHGFNVDSSRYTIHDQARSWGESINKLDRPTREAKHQAGIDYCLSVAGISEAEVSSIAVSTLFEDAPPFADKATFIPHHLAHCASSFYLSPFEESAILTVDGYGTVTDHKSTSILLACGENHFINHVKTIEGSFQSESQNMSEIPDSHINFSNSLGVLYQNISMLLGMGYFNEGKTMGLSSYGKQNSAFYFMDEHVTASDNGDLSINNLEIFIQCEETLTKAAGELSPDQYFQFKADCAFKLQQILEDSVFKLCRYLHKKSQSKNLCLAGGVALNSVVNGKITKNTPFENIFIPPAAGDGGIAIGAAMISSHADSQVKRHYIKTPFSPYTGKDYSFEIDQTIKRLKDNDQIEIDHNDKPIEKVAELLSQGKIVAWLNGRSEIGPRSLGNRTILADPRSTEMKDVLNHKVKHREWFRPFAPAVLEEAASQYFECEPNSYYMLNIAKVHPHAQDKIPAVTHVDGTARLQMVSQFLNPDFHHLIKSFEKLSQVPVLLNTSFNIAGQPIVETPLEAIETFLSTNIDALYLQGCLLIKL